MLKLLAKIFSYSDKTIKEPKIPQREQNGLDNIKEANDVLYQESLRMIIATIKENCENNQTYGQILIHPEQFQGDDGGRRLASGILDDDTILKILSRAAKDAVVETELKSTNLKVYKSIPCYAVELSWISAKPWC